MKYKPQKPKSHFFSIEKKIMKSLKKKIYYERVPI